MDDSERSYGYSKDIYHGSRGAGGHYDGPTGDPERSYEYGPESDGFPDPENVEISPEEAAIHVEDTGLNRSGGDEQAGHYDHDRGSSYAGGESFTWENEGQEVAAGSGETSPGKPRKE